MDRVRQRQSFLLDLADEEQGWSKASRVDMTDVELHACEGCYITCLLMRSLVSGLPVSSFNTWAVGASSRLVKLLKADQNMKDLSISPRVMKACCARSVRVHRARRSSQSVGGPPATGRCAGR
jgi:hypothetical protein